MEEYRAIHPAQEFCITGHSLGAALATLTFQRLAEKDAPHARALLKMRRL